MHRRLSIKVSRNRKWGWFWGGFWVPSVLADFRRNSRLGAKRWPNKLARAKGIMAMALAEGMFWPQKLHPQPSPSTSTGQQLMLCQKWKAQAIELCACLIAFSFLPSLCLSSPNPGHLSLG